MIETFTEHVLLPDSHELVTVTGEVTLDENGQIIRYKALAGLNAAKRPLTDEQLNGATHELNNTRD